MRGGCCRRTAVSSSQSGSESGAESSCSEPDISTMIIRRTFPFRGCCTSAYFRLFRRRCFSLAGVQPPPPPPPVSWAFTSADCLIHATSFPTLSIVAHISSDTVGSGGCREAAPSLLFLWFSPLQVAPPALEFASVELRPGPGPPSASPQSS